MVTTGVLNRMKIAEVQGRLVATREESRLQFVVDGSQ